MNVIHMIYNRTCWSLCLTYILKCLGICWLLIAIFNFFVKNKIPTGIGPFLLILGICILFAFFSVFPRQKIKINISNTDSTLIIKFGDIFRQKGCIAIPVNEFFDSKLGDHVSEKSLHGEFIMNILQGNSSNFDLIVADKLKQHTSITVKRCSGNNQQYPIGTTAHVDIENKRYFLFALCKTDIKTLKAHADVSELWTALEGLWENIRNYSNGYDVSIPLIGSGLSGVGLPAENLIDIIILSFIDATKKCKVTNNVYIILSATLREKIQLLHLKQKWR